MINHYPTDPINNIARLRTAKPWLFYNNLKSNHLKLNEAFSVLILDLRFHSLVGLDGLRYRLSFQDAVHLKTLNETSSREIVSIIHF